MALVAQRVAGAGGAQLGHRADVAGMQRLDGDLLLAAHDVQRAEPFLVALALVPDAAVGAQGPGVHTQVGLLADERIGGRLPDVGRQRALVGCGERFLTGLALCRSSRHLGGGGHQAQHGIQQRERPDPGRPGDGEHRHELPGLDRLSEAACDLLGGQLLAGQVLLQQRVVALGGGLDDQRAGFLRGLLQLGRDRGRRLAVARVGLHREQVDHAFELMLLAHRQLHRDEAYVRRELAHRGQRALEGGVVAVHLADDDEARQFERLTVVPGELGADLHPGDRIDQHHRPVGHAQGRDHLADEVGVAGRVEQIDLVVFVLERKQGSGQRQLAADLLVLEVGDRVAFFDLTHPVDGAGMEQERLAQRGLSAAAVRDQGDVADGVGCIVLHRAGDPPEEIGAGGF